MDEKEKQQVRDFWHNLVVLARYIGFTILFGLFFTYITPWIPEPFSGWSLGIGLGVIFGIMYAIPSRMPPLRFKKALLFVVSCCLALVLTDWSNFLVALGLS